MHGQLVDFTVPLMGAAPGESFTARQCTTSQIADLPSDACGDRVTGTAGQSEISFGLVVRWFAAESYEADDGDTRFRVIDCMQGPISPVETTQCYLELETPSYVFPRLLISFDRVSYEAAKAGD